VDECNRSRSRGESERQVVEWVRKREGLKERIGEQMESQGYEKEVNEGECSRGVVIGMIVKSPVVGLKRGVERGKGV
jgi:hypothetical protein